MKKILLSIAMLGVVGAFSIGATTAIFSDEEASTGNTFTAGAIDLQIDNESYYNGELNKGTTWLELADLDDGNGPGEGGEYLFFDFGDVKPGDYGEDTISLHVQDNDSWLCVDVTLRSDDDNGLTEPEEGDGDATDGAGNGELADAIDFIWWADDGDNVFEDDETLLPAGPLGNLDVDETATVALADSSVNIWDGDGPLPGDSVRYVGKAWCLGDLVTAPVAQGDNDPLVDPGFTCDGAPVNNVTQTDSMTADIVFYAEQSRHNDQFLCSGEPAPRDTALLTVTKSVEGGDAVIEDFDLFANAIPLVSGVQEEVPADVLLTVNETDSSGLYVPTFGGDCNASGEVTLGVDTVGSCTILNTYTPADLTVDKILIITTGGVGASDFTLHISGPGIDMDVTDDIAELNLPAGDYTVTETPTGPAAALTFDTVYSGACTDNGGASGSVTLAHGDSLTCVVTNTELVP